MHNELLRSSRLTDVLEHDFMERPYLIWDTKFSVCYVFDHTIIRLIVIPCERKNNRGALKVSFIGNN